MSLASFPRGLFVGAVIMYFLDPDRGRRRRAHFLDAIDHARRVERRLLERGARDAGYRAQGALERVRHPQRADVDDDVLAARVTSQLGRTVSHPSAIDVIVRHGVVTLRGPVLAPEAEPAIRCVARIVGVECVIDELEPHDAGDRIPALQGGRARRRTELWTPAAQAGAVIGGAMLASYGWLVRRGFTGLVYAAAGTALALRGGLNLPLSRILGLGRGGEGITVQKTITVRAPVEDVFALWSQLERFPRFMQHVQHIERIDDMHSRWTVDGPSGVPITFETVTTRVAANREIAWETLPEQVVEHTGRVRFERVPQGCRIDVRMTYHPPAGVVGHALAYLLRSDPKARMDDDLMRMKALLEEGRTRAHGERVDTADLLHR